MPHDGLGLAYYFSEATRSEYFRGRAPKDISNEEVQFAIKHSDFRVINGRGVAFVPGHGKRPGIEMQAEQLDGLSDIYRKINPNLLKDRYLSAHVHTQLTKIGDKFRGKEASIADFSRLLDTKKYNKENFGINGFNINEIIVKLSEEENPYKRKIEDGTSLNFLKLLRPEYRPILTDLVENADNFRLTGAEIYREKYYETWDKMIGPHIVTRHPSFEIIDIDPDEAEKEELKKELLNSGISVENLNSKMEEVLAEIKRRPRINTFIIPTPIGFLLSEKRRLAGYMNKYGLGKIYVGVRLFNQNGHGSVDYKAANIEDLGLLLPRPDVDEDVIEEEGSVYIPGKSIITPNRPDIIVPEGLYGAARAVKITSKYTIEQALFETVFSMGNIPVEASGIGIRT